MLKRTLSLVAAILLCASVSAEEAKIRDDHPQTYTVVRGDTLWDIAARFLRNPWAWPEIWQANSQIENPHLIYPGDVISLVYVDGQPRLIRGRPDLVKLSPRIRDMGGRKAVGAIPLDELKAWLEQLRVLSPGDARNLPYVVAVEENENRGEERNYVYVRELNARSGDEVDIVRPTTVYREVPGKWWWDRDAQLPHKSDWDGVTQGTLREFWNEHVDDWRRKKMGRVLGHEVEYIGRARVASVGDPTVLVFQRGTREVKAGDLILPVESKPYDAAYSPHTPERVPDNMRVLASSEALTTAGPKMVVALSRGAADGVSNGQVYSLYTPGEKIHDRVKYPDDDARTVFSKKRAKVQLPDDFTGHVMVFRTFEKISYGLVMDGVRPVRVANVARAPQSL
jgi:LysM domain